jgi:cytochrome c peroxidase
MAPCHPQCAHTVECSLSKEFFWDARASTLEEQIVGPLYSPIEMGNNPVKLLSDLNSNELYTQLFNGAFPNSSEAITLEEIYTAIIAFQTSLISLNSRYDQYAHGNHKALSPSELEGMNIYRSFVARCSECHTPPLFITNQQIAVIGTPEPVGMP